MFTLVKSDTSERARGSWSSGCLPGVFPVTWRRPTVLPLPVLLHHVVPRLLHQIQQSHLFGAGRLELVLAPQRADFPGVSLHVSARLSVTVCPTNITVNGPPQRVT